MLQTGQTLAERKVHYLFDLWDKVRLGRPSVPPQSLSLASNMGFAGHEHAWSQEPPHDRLHWHVIHC